MADDFQIAQTMEQNSISDTLTSDLHIIMEHSPSVTNYYHLISMRKFHSSNARRIIPRMSNDHVNLCSEENNAGLVVHLCRIVPHLYSAVFPALYMCIKSAIEILLFYFIIINAAIYNIVILVHS